MNPKCPKLVKLMEYTEYHPAKKPLRMKPIIFRMLVCRRRHGESKQKANERRVRFRLHVLMMASTVFRTEDPGCDPGDLLRRPYFELTNGVRLNFSVYRRGDEEEFYGTSCELK